MTASYLAICIADNKISIASTYPPICTIANANREIIRKALLVKSNVLSCREAPTFLVDLRHRNSDYRNTTIRMMYLRHRNSVYRNTTIRMMYLRHRNSAYRTTTIRMIYLRHRNSAYSNTAMRMLLRCGRDNNVIYYMRTMYIILYISRIYLGHTLIILWFGFTEKICHFNIDTINKSICYSTYN